MERSALVLLSSIAAGAALLSVVMASILGDTLPAILLALVPILVGAGPIFIPGLARHGGCVSVIAAGVGILSAAICAQLADNQAWLFTAATPILYLALAVALYGAGRAGAAGPARAEATASRVRKAVALSLGIPLAIYIAAVLWSADLSFGQGSPATMDILGAVFVILLLATPAALILLNVRPAGLRVGYALSVVFGFMILIFALIDLGMLALAVWYFGVYFVSAGVIGLGLDGGYAGESSAEDGAAGRQEAPAAAQSMLPAEPHKGSASGLSASSQ